MGEGEVLAAPLKCVNSPTGHGQDFDLNNTKVEGFIVDGLSHGVGNGSDKWNGWRDRMDLEYLLSLLEDKDTSLAFLTLKDLEKLSDIQDTLYPYIEKFIEMTGSENMLCEFVASGCFASRQNGMRIK